MKGITPIISIIVLLLITISLAGAAYVFLGGVMTANIGRVVQASGMCVAGTEAFLTVTNMGTMAIDLGTCDTNPVSGQSASCGDLVVVRTDGGSMAGATFDSNTIPASEVNRVFRATFRDPGCTTAGNPNTCKYAFTRAGETQPVEVTVSCSG
jgi:flagellin-like protein